MEKTRGILSAYEYRKTSYRAAYMVFMAAAVALALVMIYPIVWVFLSALKGSAEVYRMPPAFLPERPLWENFPDAWKRYEFSMVFPNTVFVYLGVLAARLSVVILGAYALSRLEVPFRKFFYLFFLSTLVLPPMAYLVPSFLVVHRLGMIDTWWAVWLPAAAAPMPLLLAKNFFDGIPKELSEASRMDGASELRILGSIVLPNSKPIVAVLAIFAFLEVWNNFFWQQLVLISHKIWTVAVMIWFRSFTIGGQPPMNIQLAGMFFSLVPPLVLFMIFQKYITEGITFSGLKG